MTPEQRKYLCDEETIKNIMVFMSVKEAGNKHTAEKVLEILKKEYSLIKPRSRMLAI